MKSAILARSVFALLSTVLVSKSYAQIDLAGGNPTAYQQKAKKLFERLTGTKIQLDSNEVKTMTNLISQGRNLEAAQFATQDKNFYNITVKLMALPLSTREESVKTPFNDFSAAFIGITRDQRDARELLMGNFYYMGMGNDPAIVRSDIVKDILISNNHYADLESKGIDLSKSLTRVNGQLIATAADASMANPDPAGVLTLRTFMGSHALAGSNRRLVEYTFREFMCVPLDQFADTQASDARIGRDIDRFPGGDHNKFNTSCKGCHTVMDGYRGAFSKWDFENMGVKNSAVNPTGNGDFNIKVDNQGITTKMNKNGNVFPSGFVTVNDSFVNNAIRPANASLFDWRGPVVGNGVKDFGAMIANSKRFSQCMAKRVFNTVCRKEIDPVKNRQQLVDWGNEFETSGYKLKNLFESIAIKTDCLGN